MAKNWYPMINYDNCIECGECVDMCPNGVYDKEKSPVPNVIFTDGCVAGCKGCGDKCPAQAITYFGDDGSMSECAGTSCECGGTCGCSCC